MLAVCRCNRGFHTSDLSNTHSQTLLPFPFSISSPRLPSPPLSPLCHPQATIMTDPGMADATYVGPMIPELVEQILDKVRFGGRVCVMGKGGRE